MKIIITIKEDPKAGNISVKTEMKNDQKKDPSENVTKWSDLILKMINDHLRKFEEIE